MHRWMIALWAAAAVGCEGDGVGPEGGGVADCSVFGQELLEAFGLERQLVLNLALAQGDNYDTMAKTTGLPDPATFRGMADGFEGFDTSSIEPNPFFDEPAQIIVDLRTTADLLETALDAGSDSSDPAWADLAAFYTNGFFVGHGSSINYYLGEAGCG
ncbi:MAG: hypothetical protein KTR31_02980 [Myxococcales bacterium]|nr:hypothetical protein [Myxococcales bacterium]